MSEKSSLAERYRRHREAFTLAMEMGCLPHEAEAEIRRRAARARCEAAGQRLAAKMGAAMPARQAPERSAQPVTPWWMKD